MKTSSYALGLLLLAGPVTASTLATGDEDEKTAEERLMTLEEEVARLRAASSVSEGTVVGKFEGGKLEFASADGDFSARLGGRIHVDAMGIDADRDYRVTVGNEQDTIGLRTGRLYLAGSLMDTLDYKWQVDFAKGANKFKDFYVALKDSPVGRIQAGQFKEAMSMETLQSSNYITTMEVSSMGSAFVPARNVGLQISDHNEAETLTWALGVFKEDGSDTGFASGSGENNVTARVTGTPLRSESGDEVLHLGASYRHQTDVGGTITYKTKGPVGLSSNSAVTTGAIPADDANALQVEAAWIRGPLSFQAEYTQVEVDATGMSDPSFSGMYGLVSYFFTGEHRAYKPSAGTFSRVKVDRVYGDGEPGCGAWEAYARCGTVDLEDQGVLGGELDDLTIGVNWYLNRNSRILFNYVHMDVGGAPGNGEVDALMARWQLDF